MKIKDSILLLTEEIQFNTGADLINAVKKNKVDGVNPKTEIPEKLAQNLVDKFKNFPIQYKSQAIRLALKHVLIDKLSIEETSPYLVYFANRNKKIIKTEYKDYFDNFYNGIIINQKNFEKQVKKILEKKGKDKPLATKLYEDKNWLAVIPEDFSASCKYGKGTKWCTTQNVERFKYYTEKTPLIIITNKRLDSRENPMAKVAINTDKNQFQDAQNRSLKGEERYDYINNLPEKLQQILEKYSINKKEYFSKKNNEILTDATKKNDIEKVKEALENGADIHYKDDQALINACSNNNIELVKLLLNHGSNVHAQSDQALMESSYNNNNELIKLLITHGANIHAQEDMALIYACYRNNTKLIKFLLDHDTNIHTQNDQALISACHGNSFEAAKILLDHGADVHAQNDEALVKACLHNNIELAKILLNHNANAYAQDGRPFKIAKINNFTKLLDLLNSYLKK